MRYEDALEQFPVKVNDIWHYKSSKVGVFDITNHQPDYLMDADMIYVDSPWTLQVLNMFNKKAEREYFNDFIEFHNHFFSLIKKIRPQCCYIEIGGQNFDLYYRALHRLFRNINVWEIIYHKKNPCFLLRGSDNTPAMFDFSGLDDSVTPMHAVKYESPKKVADFCMGKGITALAALDYGVDFVGTELIKEKLALFLKRAKMRGYEFQESIQ